MGNNDRLNPTPAEQEGMDLLLALYLNDITSALRRLDFALLTTGNPRLYSMAVGRTLLTLGGCFSRIEAMLLGWQGVEENGAQWKSVVHTQAIYYFAQLLEEAPERAAKVLEQLAEHMPAEVQAFREQVSRPVVVAREETKEVLGKMRRAHDQL